MSYYPPQPDYSTPRPAGNAARNRFLLIAAGVMFALFVLIALASGGDNGNSDTGYTGESGGSSQIYGDSGSITTGDGGELIYSDSNGNSGSFGG